MRRTAFAATALAGLLALAACGDDTVTGPDPVGPPPPPPPPSVSITVSGNQPALAAATEMAFNATGSGAGSVTYAWNFGDGATGQGASVTHVYGAAGTYTVAVTATGSGGSTTVDATVVVKDLVGFWTGGIPGFTQGLILEEQSGKTIKGYPTTGITACSGRLDGEVSAPRSVKLNMFFNAGCSLGPESYEATLDESLDVMTGVYRFGNNQRTLSFTRQP